MKLENLLFDAHGRPNITAPKASMREWMKDYHFDDPRVQSLLNRRWGKAVDWNEVVVAPADLVESPLLKVAYRSP